MNLAQVARVLAGFTAFFTAVQAVPLTLALTETTTGDIHAAEGFLYSMLLGAIVAVLLGLAGRRASGAMYRRESIAVAGLCWLLAGLLGAIPLQWSGLLGDGVDAVFESVSGLTTCGGTVLGSGDYPSPEATPHSLLLWRALLQWIGGLGIVLLFGLLLGSGAGSKRLLTAESVAIATDHDQPRASAQARIVALCYVALTLLCTLSLMATGLGLFDAVCHAFTTLATGGFSTKTSVAAFDNVGAEIVLTVFMFLGGCSFAALAGTVRARFHGPDSIVASAEFRAYAVVTLAAIALVTANLVGAGMRFSLALRESSFNVVSTLSCCGYATADFQAWPPLSITILIACLLIGGCSGSAAGGFKQVRLVVCLKLIAYTLRQYVRPRSVERLKLEGEVLQAAAVSSVLAVVLLWLLCVLVFGGLYACDDRIGFLGALSTSASMQANAGPAIAAIDPASAAAALSAPGVVAVTLGPNIGPLGGYAAMHDWTKLAMSVQMVLGRLELLTLLAVATPGFWRR